MTIVGLGCDDCADRVAFQDLVFDVHVREGVSVKDDVDAMRARGALAAEEAVARWKLPGDGIRELRLDSGEASRSCEVVAVNEPSALIAVCKISR